MNPLLDRLHPYPFERLAALKKGITPNSALKHIPLSIGEPKHTPPAFVLNTLTEQVASIDKYPITKGLPELREAIGSWLNRRFALNNLIDGDKHILPVNGTREALFAFAQAVIEPRQVQTPLVMMPNPFYQIYEGAALLAGAEPYYLNSMAENNYQPDFDAISEQDWQRCQLIYLCSPNNPTGTVLSRETYQKLIELADCYDFVIASDECYSEIYPNEDMPPVGLLQVCAELGRDNFERCMVFHSLSKRSNLPGLRSGFVAGDEKLIANFLKYRTYHGCAMAIPTQLASIAAWQDEQHVIENRVLYREKFTRVAKILKGTWDLTIPEAGFNFWAQTPIDDEGFTQQLFEQQHITVLPGRYLSREFNGIDPARHHVRMAMVAPVDECIAAAERLHHFIKTLGPVHTN